MDYNKAALEMHETHHGKVGITSKVEVKTRDDLSTAYTPGVAEPCRRIKENPDDVYKYTFKGNMVAVVSNGTAVLGLGDIGPEAGLPVMEGKAVLFKEFGGVDAFPICIDAHDAASVIAACKAIAPTFGGINLEDIKSPECFEIEETLERELDIPVFHDDQHGTAIVVTAALINALRVVGKKMEDVHIVLNGPGAAGTAIIKMLMTAGAKDIVAVDQFGTLYKGCNSAEAHKNWLGEVTNPRQIKGGLKEAIEGADVFIGVSRPGILTTELCKTMNKDAIVFAMANPTPEIFPDKARAAGARVVGTGRSDFPNQVNNVLCFPFIFRGALDVGATAINEEMKLAAVRAIAELAHAEQSEVVASAYGDQDLSFGPEYIIPKPFDPRLIVKIAPAVAKAAMESGVATRPIADFDVYIDKLTEFVYKTNLFMKPIFSQARKAPKRVVLPEGEEARVLHATQELVTLGLAKPILIGRPNVIEMRIQKLGLQIKAGVDFEIVNNESDPRFKEYWTEYFQIMKRRGVTQEQAQRALISNPTVIGAIMVQRGEADAMICGTVGDYHEHFSVVKNVFGYRDGVHTAGAMNALLLPSGNTFIADTYVNDEPDAEELAEITLMAAETVRRFGIEPRVALLSHSNFGSSDCPSSSKMRQALELVRERAPELMIDGEMHGDAALVEAIRSDRMPDSPLKGSANILVMPNMEAARISYNLLRVSSSEGVTVGPVLMGVAKPVHVLTPIASVRRIVNMVALAVVEAQTQPL